MRFNNFARLVLGALLISMSSACGSNGPNYPSRGLVNGSSLPTLSGANVMQLTVDGSSCLALPSDSQNSNGSGVYSNEPCVSVTICPAGSTSSSATNCQTISGILLDTGSVGLRVFSSVLNSALKSALQPVASGSGVLTECMMYGDGSADWGPVAQASVFLGGESAANVPIQLINSTYGGSSSSNGYQICNSLSGGSSSSSVLDQGPTGSSGTGFNGILGLGLFAQDCGADCTSSSAAVNPQIYYSCSGTLTSSTSCSSKFVQAPLTSQVLNPVAALSQDNNGIIVELPTVDSGGAASASGYVVLGIGTQSNNHPASGITTFKVDSSSGEFSASFNGSTYGSFIDSGSNDYYFPAGSSTSSLADCGQFDAQDFSGLGYFCPSNNGSSDASLQVAVTGSGGSGGPNYIPFSIGNVINLYSSPTNWVFDNIGNGAGFSSGSSAIFDLGLPFYLGRNVYHGFVGSSSSLGTDAYWAF